MRALYVALLLSGFGLPQKAVTPKNPLVGKWTFFTSEPHMPSSQTVGTIDMKSDLTWRFVVDRDHAEGTFTYDGKALTLRTLKNTDAGEPYNDISGTWKAKLSHNANRLVRGEVIETLRLTRGETIETWTRKR